MKIVAIKDMSAGNDSVGEMWKETAIFEGDTPVKEIVKWAGGEYLRHPLRKQLTITVPENMDSRKFAP